jgi:ketosteroid isomerase-like protein
MSVTRLFRRRELDAIRAVVADERAALERGDAVQYLALLADDAVFMPPNLPALAGTDLRCWIEDFLLRFRAEWLDVRTEQVGAHGDLAYHAYTFTWRVTPRAGGEGNTSSGKGLHLLRRDPTGAWKLAREIWNASP